MLCALYKTAAMHGISYTRHVAYQHEIVEAVNGLRTLAAQGFLIAEVSHVVVIVWGPKCLASPLAGAQPQYKAKQAPAACSPNQAAGPLQHKGQTSGQMMVSGPTNRSGHLDIVQSLFTAVCPCHSGAQGVYAAVAVKIAALFHCTCRQQQNHTQGTGMYQDFCRLTCRKCLRPENSQHAAKVEQFGGSCLSAYALLGILLIPFATALLIPCAARAKGRCRVPSDVLLMSPVRIHPVFHGTRLRVEHVNDTCNATATVCGENSSCVAQITCDVCQCIPFYMLRGLAMA